MFVVDSNVLLYAADRRAPENARCFELIQSWRSSFSTWYTTWPILYEFLRVSTHPRVFAEPLTIQNAWRFVESLFAAPGLAVLSGGSRHRAVAAELLEQHPFVRGSILHDFHTVVLMREHGVDRIYTRDARFHQFKFIEVIDPLSVA